MKVDTRNKDSKNFYESVAEATAVGIRLRLLIGEYRLSSFSNRLPFFVPIVLG
jgi:hypothetical protein